MPDWRRWMLLITPGIAAIILAIACGADAGARLSIAPTPAPTSPIGRIPPLNLPPITEPPTATAKAGQSLFESRGGCSACHAIDGVALGVLGPELNSIATTAAGRIPGYTAEQYIREAILEPDAHIVDGYTAGLMTVVMVPIMPNLSDADIDNLVDYLLTLR